MASLPRFACILCLLVGLSACTQYSAPPLSTLEVDEGYRPLSIAGADLTIVIDTSRFVIEDEKAVAAHLGRAGSPRTQIFRLLSASFVSALKTEAPFGEVVVVGPSAEIATGADPTTASVSNRPETPFVLYIDSLHQYRSKYPSNAMLMPGMGGGDTQAVRHDVDYRLWDNRRQAVVAQGRVESEESIFLVPSSQSYVGAAEEMAEKLTQRLGVRTRG